MAVTRGWAAAAAQAHSLRKFILQLRFRPEPLFLTLSVQAAQEATEHRLMVDLARTERSLFNGITEMSAFL